MPGKILIQLVLIVATIALVAYFVQNRRKARTKASVKMGFVCFIIACVYSVLRPNDVTRFAHLLGVDRGTDLLLYTLFIAVMFTTLSTYIRFRELELRYARLARAVALTNAVAPSDDDIDATNPAHGATTTPMTDDARAQSTDDPTSRA